MFSIWEKFLVLGHPNQGPGIARFQSYRPSKEGQFPLGLLGQFCYLNSHSRSHWKPLWAMVSGREPRLPHKP